MLKTESNTTREKAFPDELVASLRVNGIERRRAVSAQDPSLLFGAAVFAHLVAGELARESVESMDLLDAGDEAGEDADTAEATADDVQALFGSLPSAGGLMPVAGGLAAVAGFPGSGSDAASVLGRQEGSAPPESNEGGDAGNRGFVSRSASAVRNGGQPDPSEASRVDPNQEAGDAQSTAADTQQQFTGAGDGSPLGAAPVMSVPVDAPEGQAMPAQSTLVDTPVAAPGVTDAGNSVRTTGMESSRPAIEDGILDAAQPLASAALPLDGVAGSQTLPALV